MPVFFVSEGKISTTRMPLPLAVVETAPQQPPQTSTAPSAPTALAVTVTDTTTPNQPTSLSATVT